jgi:hypothetical protein
MNKMDQKMPMPYEEWKKSRVFNLDDSYVKAFERLHKVNPAEEIEEMLNHLKEEDGIYLQLASALRDNPQAGRSVAGAHALETASELVDYVSSMEGPEAFINELETDGVSVYMIDLMDAYTDTMGVYKTLQQSQAELTKLVEVNTAFENRTASSDIRFHLHRFLISVGLDGLAARFVDSAVETADPDKQTTGTSPETTPAR